MRGEQIAGQQHAQKPRPDFIFLWYNFIHMQILDVLTQYAKNSLNRPFTYLYAGSEEVKVGCRVLIRFNERPIMGFVVKSRFTEKSRDELCHYFGFVPEFITSLIDREPLLNDELLTLVSEVSSYYMAPTISVLQAMLPNSLKPVLSSLKGPKIAYEDWVSLPSGLNIETADVTDKQYEALLLVSQNGEVLKKEAGTAAVINKLIEKKLLLVTKKEKQRLHLKEYEKEQPHELTFEQNQAYETILSSKKDVVLLQGVTGSGKTEVYLHLSETYLKRGKNILMLVPEISLTPIMVEYFSRRFQGKIAILHSELTPAEKYDEYRRIARGEAQIVVGARSAVFAPLQDIGLIIMDEEHVSSYKQDGLPHYHAREVAIMRAKHFGAKVVLGSATPSLETRARAQKGVYGYATMLHRVNDKALPKTTIVDLTDRRNSSYTPLVNIRPDGGNITKPNAIFSKVLFDKIGEKLARHEQVILLINHRGYSSFVSCSHCGHIFTCPECHGNLTFHKNDGLLKCHHCGYVERYPESCPQCGSEAIMRVGFGTERIAKVLEEQYPSARVCRLDSDVTRVRNNLTKTLSAFREREYDILVGTQMIAKGHDFPNVTLVGVVLADIGLSLPSYRASETTFELITQAVGRSGRAEKSGEAYIQTYNPNHYAITLGASQDYEKFYIREMQSRLIAQYPPFVYLIAMMFEGKDEERVIQACVDIKAAIESKRFKDVKCIGPIAPFYEFVAEKHRRSLLLKLRDGSLLKPYLTDLVRSLSGKGGIDITCDVDPLDY